MTIAEWLSGLGLQEYATVFESNRIDLKTIGMLSDADLKELGVESMGHRRLILAEAQNIADVGEDMALQDGMWFHAGGGYCYIPDQGPDSPFIYLSRFVRLAATHQPEVASWIIHNTPPAGTSGPALMKFWRDLATYMVSRADWNIAWKGLIYTSTPTVNDVGQSLKRADKGVCDLNWPLNAQIELLDIYNTAAEKRTTTTWGTLLNVPLEAPPSEPREAEMPDEDV